MDLGDLVKKGGEGSGKNFVLAAIHFFQVKNKISRQGHNTTQNVRVRHNNMRFNEHPHSDLQTQPTEFYDLVLDENTIHFTVSKTSSISL